MQITYNNKVTLQSNPNIPDENKVTAEDMNEIKSVVNSNEEEQQALSLSVQEIAQNVVNNSQEISNIKEEQTTQNDNIQTNSNNISDLQSNKADKSEIPTDLSQLSNDNTKFVNETKLENAISQEKTQRQNADNNLQNQVDTNKTNIQTNATNIATNTQEINTIKAEQTSQNNRLNNLETDNTTNKDNISSNTQEINNIKSEQTTQNTNIQTNADNISALTSRVTETEEDISDIQEEQAEQNTAIENNATNIESLQEENENLKKIVSQLPQVEGQGTSITLENTIEAQFTKFDVEGNSTQESTKGYQLLNPADFNDSLTNNGITFTNNGDGSITINGTSTGTAMFQLDKIKKTLKAGKYTFSLTNGIKDKLYMIWSAPYNSTNTIGTDMLYKEVTFDSDTELTYIYIQIPSGYTFNNVVVYPMIYEGSYDSSKPWEKYTYGASPNPNYEQPILSSGDNENIWNGEIERGAINGDGLDVDATNRVRNVGYYELNKGTYTLSYKGAEQSVVYIFNANKVKVNNPSWENGKSTFTLEENGYIKYALKQSDNREMNVNDVSEIKLEKGNKASGYSPYGMGSINEKIQNKNVWDIDKFKNLYGTNSYETYNNVECLKLAGATQRYNFEGEENTQYTFQFKLIGSTLNDEIGAFSFVYSDGTSDYHGGILTPKTYIFTSKVNKTLVRIIWSGWSAGHFIYIDKNSMQLEPGTTATPYVPHEDQDYSIPVQQPMRSIGDVRDKFVKVNGVWNEKHLPYIASYNGETLPTDVYTEEGGIKYCNSKSMSTTGQFSNGASVQYVDENNWTYLPCTETQIQQLENRPSTYKDFTIINSQDETEAYLEVSGIRDIDTMFDKVTNAIVSLGGNV